jgi:isochorismate pyruvate lyase
MAARAQEVNLDSPFAAAKEAGMTNERVSPADCRTMAEVRQGVDALDRQIVALIGERFRYMDAAARIKPVREAVRDEGRKAQVIANVEQLARAASVPPAVAAQLYEGLIEASIAYELGRFDARGADGSAVSSPE